MLKFYHKKRLIKNYTHIVVSSEIINSKKENVLINTYGYKALLSMFFQDGKLSVLELYTKHYGWDGLINAFPQIFVKLLMPYPNILHRSTYCKYFMSLQASFKFKNSILIWWTAKESKGNLLVCINRITSCAISTVYPPKYLTNCIVSKWNSKSGVVPFPHQIQGWVKAILFSNERKSCSFA